MRFSDDILIEYLLGETPVELAQLIEAQCRFDADLVARLRSLRFYLGQAAEAPVFEPPGDLVDLTLARVQSVVEGGEQPSSSAGAVGTKGGHAEAWEMAGGRRAQFVWDSTVLVLSLTVLCCLVLPAILRVRFDSRRLQCAENLRSVGWQLFDFASNDPSHRFPRVFMTAPYDFAGIYAVHLQSSGRDLSPFQLNCPSQVGLRAAPLISDPVPTFSDLGRMSLSQLQYWRQIVGGDYAYSLGVIEDGQGRAPRYEGRPEYAVLADAPQFTTTGEIYSSHDGAGINVLFEDGRVLFLEVPETWGHAGILDHPFRNLRGRHGVGLTDHDSALGPSGFSPLGY